MIHSSLLALALLLQFASESTPTLDKAIAICIGVNYVNADSYDDGDWEGRLDGCENDAQDMYQIATNAGFRAELYPTKSATRSNITNAIISAAKRLTPDGILMISFSGHGGAVEDKNRDEPDDHLDETWCLYDGQFFDDELYQLWTNFSSRARIIVFSDSCHSGSVLQALSGVLALKGGPETEVPKLKAMPAQVAVQTARRFRKEYNAIQDTTNGEGKLSQLPAVQLIAACRDDQRATNGLPNSLFTKALKKVWNNGHFSGNYGDFHKAIRAEALLWFPQEAQHSWVDGRTNLLFQAQTPFSVQPPK